MMLLSAKIELLENYAESISAECKRMASVLHDAKVAWPDHQVLNGAKWEDRSARPPKGCIWASDGVRVWLIHSDGEAIPESATAVKYWTAAWIPAPPSLT